MQPLHPLHAILLGGALPAFLGVLLSDTAYYRSFEIQWKNFASWLLVGGLVFVGFALVWALFSLARKHPRPGRRTLYIVLLLATFVIGSVNVLVHAGDAWASMPAGLVLSVISGVLAAAAAWLGFSRVDVGGA